MQNREIINKYLEIIKEICFYPFFYKIISISALDIYNLFFIEKISTPNNTIVESFTSILDFIFFDISLFYDFLTNKEYSSYNNTINDILGINFSQDIIEKDTEKIYSNDINLNGIVDILNKNKNNIDVIKLFEIYPYFNAETNEYYKKTKFISIKNFINFTSILLSPKYENNSQLENIINILNYTIYNNLDSIYKCANIYKNMNIHTSDRTNIINKLDNILNEYSSDSVLTFLKIRSDELNDYNARFKYKLFSKNIKQKKLYFDDKNQIESNIINTDKSKIMKLDYNNDDFKYYNQDGSISNEVDNLEKKIIKMKENIIFNNETDYDYTYIFGPFSEIYDYKYTNKEISEKMDVVINSLLIQKPVFIIGYGASGAGKTSTLIYFNKGNNMDTKNGILVHLCNRMANEHNFLKLELKYREVYREQNSTDTQIRYIPDNTNDKISFEYDKSENSFKLKTFNTDDKTYIYNNKYTNKNENETVFNDKSTLGEIVIHLVDNDRFVSATTNNPNSSRSHSLIFIKLIKNINNINYETTLIIGDFAGVENLFDCELDEFQYKFNNVKRDDTQLDSIKKDKLNNKIIELNNLLNDTELSQDKKDKIYKDIEYLKNKIKSFENEKYYYTYPIEPYFSNTQKKYETYILDFNFFINSIFKNKNITPPKYEFNISELNIPDKLKSDSNILILNKPLSKTYNHNSAYFNNIKNYLNEIFSLNYSKTEIEQNLLNLFINLSNIIDINSFLKKINEFQILLLKGILCLKYENKNVKIEELLNLDIGSNNTLFKKFNTYFSEKDKDNNKIRLYKYIKKFIEYFNTIKKEYDINQVELFEKNKEKNYGKEICKIRRNEGVFINNSLEKVRDLINFIIIEKNKYKLTISPPFVDECLNFYCNKDICFKIKREDIYKKYESDIKNNIKSKPKENIPFQSIIFNIISEEIGIINIVKLIISVFCVFNVSKKANNPPVIPYIDINKMKFLYNNNKIDEFKNEFENFKFNKDYDKNKFIYPLNKFVKDESKILNIINNNYYLNLLNLIPYINKNNANEEKYKTIIQNFFTFIDNFNSSSAIGTLEFIDSLSKYNTISNICNYKYFNDEQKKTFDIYQ